MAGRQGVSAAVLENPNEDGRFQHNSYDVSELAFSDSFVGSCLFASVFEFCQRNDTRNDTRTECLRSSKRLCASQEWPAPRILARSSEVLHQHSPREFG